MSSFSDTFTREENKETQYDDSAFYTFAGTILLVIIFPLIYFIFKRIFITKKYLDRKRFKNCECKSCTERVNRHYARIKKQNLNFTFYFMIFMVILLSYLFYLSYFEIVNHGSNFKRFDPYEILEISPGAEEKQIKKAYRKLTLKYHPDKNPNNLQAKAKFIMIAKAYEALTDEVARKNFEMYGNPDGPGSMRLAVGLPSFVLNKKNHMPILFLFLIFIVVIIPSFVWFWFSNSNKYDESGMLVGDQRIFYEFLNENILLRQMPFVLGAAMEFTVLKIRQEEAKELEKLWKSYKDVMPKHKEEIIPFPNRKAICMIYAYLNNYQFKSPSLNEDMEEILKKAPLLIGNMYTMAVQLTQIHMIQKNVKFFGYNCIKSIVEFSQIIHQRLPYSNNPSPFLQLPHFNDNRIKAVKKASTNIKLTDLPSFLSLSPDERRTLLKSEFKEEEIEEIEKVSKAFPIYKLDVEAFVEGFEEILFEDFVTIKVTVERGNIEEDKEIGISHSASFPDLIKEKVCVILTLQDKIIFETNLEVDKKITTHEFKHMVREIGSFKFQAELFSLNYKGVDVVTPFEIDVKKESKQRTVRI